MKFRYIQNFAGLGEDFDVRIVTHSVSVPLGVHFVHTLVDLISVSEKLQAARIPVPGIYFMKLVFFKKIYIIVM